MRRLAGLLLAGTTLTAAAAAAAAETRGWYMGAQLGLTLAQDTSAAGSGVPTISTDYDPGYGILGQVGYGFGQWRVEGELGWRTNEVDTVNGADGSGDLRATSLMGNLYYDFMPESRFSPYLGVGLGGANVSAKDFSSAGVQLVDDDDTVFAYQGIVGASYELDRNLSIKADYRYIRADDAKFTVPGGSAKADYASHNVMVGFVWRFAAPEPKPVPVQAAPPPPPPPPPPPKVEAPPPKGPDSYMVFFDWDRADITPQARETLAKVAANAKAGKATRLDLTGHADRSGPEPYNMRLSLRRADNVKKVLVGLGLPADAISMVGKGETSPLVPTPDGVREPQNRRVEIIVP
ncbi:MAG: OmpA family protein [Rhodospirillales bacterium]|nr:OmpA family protein [Rhodospirillales bacterium]